MLTLVRRLVAAAIIATLCAGNVAVCAGWQATPEARMACCKNSTSCPMHTAGSRDSSSKKLSITQAQADDCCAATSNRTQSPAASQVFGLAAPTTLPLAPTLVVPVPALALQEWRALVPLPPSAVPRHLLLSVLLV